MAAYFHFIERNLDAIRVQKRRNTKTPVEYIYVSISEVDSIFTWHPDILYDTVLNLLLII